MATKPRRNAAPTMRLFTALFAIVAMAATMLLPQAQAQGDDDAVIVPFDKSSEDVPGLSVANATSTAQVVLNTFGGLQDDGSDGVKVYVGDNLQHQFVHQGTGWAYEHDATPLDGVGFRFILETGGLTYSSVGGGANSGTAGTGTNLRNVSQGDVSDKGSAVITEVYADVDGNLIYNADKDFLIAVETSTDGETAEVLFDVTVTAPTAPDGALAPSSLQMWIDSDTDDLFGTEGDEAIAYGLLEDGERVAAASALASDLSEIGAVRFADPNAGAETAITFFERGDDEFVNWTTGDWQFARAWALDLIQAREFDAALHDNGFAVSYALSLAAGGTDEISAGLRWASPVTGPQDAVILDTPCLAYDSSTPMFVGEVRTVALTGNLAAQGGDAAGCVPPSCALSVIVSIQAIDPVIEGNLRLSGAGVAALGGVVNYAPNDLNNANTVIVDVSGGAHQVDIVANGATPGATSTDVRLVVMGYFVGSDVPESCETEATPVLEFHPVDPCAVADTRTGLVNLPSAFEGPIILTAAGQTFGVDVVDPIVDAQESSRTETNCGIPASAEVAVVNVVAINAESEGGLRVGAGPESNDPPFIVVPFQLTEPNSLTNSAVAYAPIDASTGEISVMPVGVAGDEVHFRVVVLGYMDDAAVAGGLKWVPLPAPCAAFDTRSGTGAFAGPRTAAADSSISTRYQISGVFPASQGGTSAQGANTDCGVPASAAAIQLNLVGLNAAGPGNMRVASSTTYFGGVLNFDLLDPEMDNSNAIIVPLDGTGGVFVQPNCGCDFTGLVDVRGVVLGYYI